MFGLGGRRPMKIGKQFQVGCEVMSAQNKVGLLKKNEKGEYLDIVFGALEFRNSTGSTYSLESGEDLLRPGSLFSDMLTSGQAKGEYWHPKREAGWTDEQWFQRIMYCEEKYTSHLHTSMWIDMIKPHGYDRKIPAFIGNLLPTGPYGDTLEKQLDTPQDNVSFSIRSITDDIKLSDGTFYKKILAASGFDHVTRPGIKIASKANAISLENASSAISLTDMIHFADNVNSDGVGFEARQQFKKVIHDISRQYETKVFVPASSTWK